MSKNAYVLTHHYGDDGIVREGMILENMPTQRFATLEKNGLVREATLDEVKAGYQPAISPDESANLEESDVTDPIEIARAEVTQQVNAFIENMRAEHTDALEAEAKRADDAVAALGAAHQEMEDMMSRNATMIEALIKRAETAEHAVATAQKAAPEPVNKKAADPANKSA